MRLSKLGARSLMISLLAVAVAAGPSIGSFAQTGAQSENQTGAPNDAQTGNANQKKGAGTPPPALVTEAITAGVVTTSGTVRVNDNAVPTGTTVLSGSIITTASDGKATIDMGPQGLLEMRPNTKLWLNVPGGPIKVDLRECGSITETVPAGVAALVAVDKQSNIRVSVVRGKVKVTRDGKDLYMKDKEERTFDKVWLVTGISDSQFILDCDEEVAAAYWPGPLTLMGLLITAGGVTTVVLGKHPLPPGNQATPILP
jgi:hypothetical protein